MSQSRFSLSWGAHKANICTGLSSLQQNGEFVDMTLAADGHHVKVHQVIMALASPYIKELISSAQCPHPIIFLNKISYNTLSAILEYIYMGEVLVSIENLTELIEAGKELHIKGLEDMKLNQAESTVSRNRSYSDKVDINEKEEVEAMEDEYCYFEITNARGDEKYVIYNTPSNTHTSEIPADSIDESLDDNAFEEVMQTQEDDTRTELLHEDISNDDSKVVIKPSIHRSTVVKKSAPDPCEVQSVIQYTVSNQGSLQMILNRFMYYLKHTKRDGTRQWRCVDYLGSCRCPALVVTNDDVVTQRISAHTHTFHDKRILKKVQAGAIFTAIHDAEKEGNNKKNKSLEPCEGTRDSE